MNLLNQAVAGLETSEIPPEIADAARLIENWMKGQGFERWELMGICSRNHANAVRTLLEYAYHSPACPFPANECDCGLKELLLKLNQ